MEINTVCVCGAGTMGSGIAQVAAAAGKSVVLYELNGAVLEKARAGIAKNLQTLVEKGKLEAPAADHIIGRIRFTSSVDDCVADLVVEAIIEKMEAKTALFARLAGLNGPQTIFASNTSSLSISALASTLPAPGRVAGLHFFNPAPLMKLVEVVKGKDTDPAVTEALVAFTKAVGKVPVVCADAPGFIVNRVARPYYIESLRLAEEGVPFETIDRLLEAQGFKMGPFKLMDLIGNDVNYAVSCSVYEQMGNPERLKPSNIQKERVESGNLGRKTGKGYYDYSK
ncbi:3-hydroxybutyryl-CoA dehydrogenase [Flaviaesturariibacter flavus]|uniref:3-hydroxybutyryl-CoA dehydrogenase n=1 Tax=Flaviaesturariibacter flavus TaxID=2502780 RepID=A0A4V2NVD7_9BACT|nr:3-hydroxyacyl-CoA dehydrogenase NAD-binding domain-containing protein [Flaviaesturariibacter flavus]TCJ13116.1 3-hydroxybutyryl-CoA dehydrogenase [Flaviaesturariibacter flavus]